MAVRELHLPVKLDEDYTCQGQERGRDGHGEQVYFDDLLHEGDLVPTFSDGDNTYGPHGLVVRRDDGLWIEATEPPMCPDGGTCHHSCGHNCFRVLCCDPLSAAKFPGDRWPEGAKPIRAEVAATSREHSS